MPMRSRIGRASLRSPTKGREPGAFIGRRDTPQPMSKVSAEKQKQIQASTDALNAGDFDSLTEVFHPELEHHSVFGALEGEVYRGIDGQRRRWENVQETWGEFSIEVVEVHDVDEERAVVVLRLTGTAKTSGVPLDSLVGQLWTWQDCTVGRIVSYTDPREAIKAAGL